MAIRDVMKVNIPGPSGPAWHGLTDDATSLEHFGTIAFGNEMMDVNKTCTDVDGNEVYLFRLIPERGAISLDNWFAFVPEVYRAAVTRETERVFARYNKTKLTDKALHLFVADLQRSIWDNVEPVK